MKYGYNACRVKPSGWALLILVVLTTFVTMSVGVAADGGATDWLNLDFSEVDIREVMRAISVQQGVNVIADPDVTGPVTIRLERVTAEEGLKLLAASYGWTLERHDDLYRLRQGDRSPAASAVRLNSDTGYVTIDSGDQPLGVLLRSVAKQSGFSLAFSHGVADRAGESISIYLHDQPPLRALEIMLHAAGLHMRQDEDTVFIHDGVWSPSLDPSDQEMTMTPLPQGMGLLRLSDGLLDLELRHVTVGTVLRELVQRFDPDDGLVPIFADRNVSETPISGAVTQVPLVEGLAALFTPYGLHLSEAGGGYRIAQIDPGPPYTLTYVDGLMAVSAKDASMGDLLRDIAVLTSVTIILPDKLPDGISVDLQPMDPWAAVALLLDMIGYRMEPFGEGIYRVIPPDTRPLRIEREGSLYSLEAQNVRLSSVLHELSEVSGENILLESGPDPTVTMSVRHLTLSHLLHALLIREGGQIEERSGLFLVRTGRPGPSGTSDREDHTGPRAEGLLPAGFSYLDLGPDGIDAQFRDVSMGDLFWAVAQVGGPQFAADQSVINDRMSGAIKGEPGQALRTFLIAEGYRTFPLGDSVLVHSGRNNEPIVHVDDDGLFYLDISGAELANIIRDMAHKAGRSVIVYSHVRSNLNQVRLFGVTFEEGIQHLLRGTTFAVIERDGILLVGEGVTPRFDSRELFQTKIIDLSHVSAQHVMSLLPASLPSQNVRPLSDGWGLVVTGSHELVAQYEAFISSIDRPTSVRALLLPLRYADGAEAASLVSRRFPREVFEYIESHNAFLLQGTPEMNSRIQQYISTIDVPEMATKTVVVPLQHMMAEEAKSHLPSVFDAGRVLVIADQNALVITGRDEQIEAMRDYLQAIDIRNPQIRFDVMIVEINDRTTTQLGFSGATDDGSIKFDMLAGSPFTWMFGSVQTGSALMTTLSALVQEGRANLLANPRLTTLSGKEASFNVLTTSRFWSPQTDTGGGTDNGGSSTIPVFRTIETGIRLRLLPWISASGEITIELSPEISDSNQTTGGGSLPSTNDRSVHTTVRVRDGETFVIGGLIQRSEQTDVAKVPILGDLPILGRLFRSENRGEVETEFVIAITSHLVDFPATDTTTDAPLEE